VQLLYYHSETADGAAPITATPVGRYVPQWVHGRRRPTADDGGLALVFWVKAPDGVFGML
jgi:hypothetical protein